MIRHIFTLFWNQKKKYGGMFVEQAVVFVILVFCFVNLGEVLPLYYTPGMLNTDNTLSFGPSRKSGGRSLSIQESDEIMDRVCETLRKRSCVETISTCAFFTPYVRGEEMSPHDTLRYDRKSLKVYVKGADEYTNKVFGIEVEEGEWLSTKMLEDGSYPAVVTRQLAEQFGWHDVVGRNLSFNGQAYTIVGMIAGVKQEARKSSQPTLIVPYEVSGYSRWSERIARVRAGEEKAFSELLDKEFTRLFSGTNQEIGMCSLSDVKIATMLDDILTMGSVVIPTAFLLIFTFIGTFGLFWLYSSKRRKEFALRIVVGSSASGLYRFVISESLLLSLSALIPGIMLFWVVYAFNTVNLIALVTACFVMVVFAVFSAWYPAYKVAGVNPVEAMREQ